MKVLYFIILLILFVVASFNPLTNLRILSFIIIAVVSLYPFIELIIYYKKNWGKLHTHIIWGKPAPHNKLYTLINYFLPFCFILAGGVPILCGLGNLSNYNYTYAQYYNKGECAPLDDGEICFPTYKYTYNNEDLYTSYIPGSPKTGFIVAINKNDASEVYYLGIYYTIFMFGVIFFIDVTLIIIYNRIRNKIYMLD